MHNNLSTPHDKSIEEAFFLDGYRLADGNLKEKFTPDQLFTAIKQMYEAIDGLIDSFISRCKQTNTKIDCAKGCEWCCHQPVFASTHEMIYLTAHLNITFNRKEIRIMTEISNQKAEKTNNKPIADLLKINQPCALLSNGACSAYEHRPMACRIYLSSNVKTCLKRFNHEESIEQFPALFDFILRAGRNMNEGFASRLRELGYKITENRMEYFMPSLLSAYQLQEDWFNGKSISTDFNWQA